MILSRTLAHTSQSWLVPTFSVVLTGPRQHMRLVALWSYYRQCLVQMEGQIGERRVQELHIGLASGYQRIPGSHN